MAFDTVVTINSVDVTSYVVSYKVVDTTDEITPATIILSNNVLSVLDPSIQQTVVIQRGNVTSTDNTIFSGHVASIDEESQGAILIEAFDKLWKLKRIVITKTYDINIDSEAGVISAIAEDLIENQGASLTASVEGTGTVNVLQKYFMLNKSLYDALIELAEIVGYQLYYNPDDDKVHFEPKGFTASSTVLEVGTNVSNIPKWKTDYTRIANIINLIGDLQELETTETEVAAGAQTEFTITRVPESVKVTDDGTLQTGGISGQTSTFDYSVDKENKKIIFESGRTVGHTIVINYSYLEPIKLILKNPTSQAKYGDYTIVKHINTIKTTEDAEHKIQEIRDKFGDPIISTALQVINTYGLQAGLSLRTVDNTNNKDVEVKIRRYVYNYPVIIDEVLVDDEPIYEDYVIENEILARIMNLERKNQQIGTLINTLIAFDRDFKPRRRYIKLQKEVAAGNGAIFDHPTFGIFGTAKFGSPFGAATTKQLIQGNMTYEEYAYDTDFHDSVNSTATFSTVNQDISFTSGQIWYSEAIDIGTTVGSLRVDLGTTTGTLLIEISSDNKATWQTITEGILTAVTTSDATGTFIRITENAAGTASIDLTQDSFGQNTEPVIKVLLVE